MKTKLAFLFFLLATVFFSSCDQQKSTPESNQYESSWESLRNHQNPEWLREAKFGIYTHWGIYSATATSGNATWSIYSAYQRPGSVSHKEFTEKYGPLTKDFGYKDLISSFRAENFDANEWADLFVRSGARFAGPVAEHHDGFAMWDTKYSDWNAARMGPKRDVVGELEKAIKAKGLKFVTAFHHAANWYFFPTWDTTKDCSNPAYSGLYGPVHGINESPNTEFCEEWYGKLKEVVDKYDPDFVWFDFELDLIPEKFVRDFVTYFYNHAIDRNKEVVISYKDQDIPPGVALLDHENAQEGGLTQYEWITDTSIEELGWVWGYLPDLKYKSADRLIDNLIDRVSKNGYLLLNVGPKPDGTIPEGAKESLLAMGKWLDLNGEAIYGTTAWVKYGEGPTRIHGLESSTPFTSEDIRFTVKADTLYAILLDWPENGVTLIKSLVPHSDPIEPHRRKFDPAGYYFSSDEIQSISMIGYNEQLSWKLIPETGLQIELPVEKPCDYAFVLKIVRKMN
jgi:alpha-L-fucosidase